MVSGAHVEKDDFVDGLKWLVAFILETLDTSSEQPWQLQSCCHRYAYSVLTCLGGVSPVRVTGGCARVPPGFHPCATRSYGWQEAVDVVG